jgi:hypothetical protein
LDPCNVLVGFLLYSVDIFYIADSKISRKLI